MVKDLITKLQKQELALSQSLTALDNAIAELETVGLTDGKPTWNSGKYLYMYHPDPSKKGGRDRRYIGSDPEKVRLAMEAVQRTELHKRLLKQHHAAEALLERINGTLNRLYSDVALEIDQYDISDTVDLTIKPERRWPNCPGKRSNRL